MFINPPYTRGQIAKWVKKAYEESRKDWTKVVMLMPSRTDTKYWHEYVMRANEIYFIKGRVKFERDGNDNKKADCAPFPSCVVVFENVKSSDHEPWISVI